MTLNKSKGNMYPFVSHTFSPMSGGCIHRCKYCYMQHRNPLWFEQPLKLRESDFKINLGSGRFIFVESAGDMFADNVPKEWIKRILEYCSGFDNKYLFQSKNPKRFREFLTSFPPKTVLGITVETNYPVRTISQAPDPHCRIEHLYHARTVLHPHVETMVSIEPIMDFDLTTFLHDLYILMPDFVAVGADSKGHKLPEPSPEKVKALIEELKKFTEVKIKDNLARILKTEGKE